MDYELRWQKPAMLFHSFTLIYEIDEDALAQLPGGPGVYVFARVHGKNVYPLYVGQSLTVRKRVSQHLTTNVKLMRGIQKAPNGERRVYGAELTVTSRMNVGKALTVIEKAMISTAHVEGHELLNVQGTKTLVHTIKSSGNREARSWLPDNTIALRRA